MSPHALKPGPPAPPAGSHAHFDAISASPNVVVAESLRDPASLARVGQVDYQSRWAIDPTFDAAKLTFPVGSGMSLGPGQQLWFTFPSINIAMGNTFSFQIELMYSTQWGDSTPAASGGWSGNMKTFRLDNDIALTSPETMWEHNYFSQDNAPRDFASSVRMFTLGGRPDRVYLHSAYERNVPWSTLNWDDGGQLPSPPLPNAFDWQTSIRTALANNILPTYQDHLDMRDGDVLKPFLNGFYNWTRVTHYWRYYGPGELRWETWHAAENTDPVQTFGQKDDPIGVDPVWNPANSLNPNGVNTGKRGLGINTYYTGETVYPDVPFSGDGTSYPGADYMINNALNKVRVEFNSSTAGLVNVPYEAWVRNACIWSSTDNSVIPLGGRPMQTV